MSSVECDHSADVFAIGQMQETSVGQINLLVVVLGKNVLNGPLGRARVAAGEPSRQR